MKRESSHDAPTPLVGLLARDSPDQLVGMLAILKVGAAFVPLNTGWPDARILAVTRDAPLRLLVADAANLARARRLAETCGIEACPIDDDARAGELVVAPPIAPDPDRLCYVIYTSGSTGEPKGVAIRHRNLLPLFEWARGYFGLGPHIRTIRTLSLAFDFGVFEVLATLSYGGSLHYFEDRLERLHELGALIAEHRINTLHATPSLFAELVAHGGSLHGLELVHLGGEVLPASLVARAHEQLNPRCRLFNGYGPTETTINTTIEEVDRLAVRDPVPIGRPTAQTYVYILDRQGGIAPIGVPGELYVGGAGLSPGYLHRPGATAAAFVPDPFDPRPGMRMYRTGDLARFGSSGAIEYLGRRDDQVKIRGFRIELGEIEAALRVQPGVADAAVVARGSEGNKRLVAYVVGEARASVLRDALKLRLPQYMVPAVFVSLTELPRTTNGKIDRRALPDPEPGALQHAHVAPRTPTEELLAGIWRDVLALPRVGASDDFFELGGHSLLAAQVAARALQLFGAELPLRAVFEASTLEALAARIDAVRGRGTSLPAIERAPAVTVPLSYSQERLWFLDQLEGDAATYSMPGAVRLEGTLDHEALRRALEEVARRHEVLRTRFDTVDGKPVATVDGPPPAWQIVDLRDTSPAERAHHVERAAVTEAQRPFDLRRGPLLRSMLLQVGETEHVLVVTMHHIAADGWSIGVLIRELGALYRAYASGRASPLPELAIQYSDYAAWQRRWIGGQHLDGEVAFWRGQLAGAPPLLALPADRPRPPVQRPAGAHHGFDLAGDLTKALEALALREGMTLFMLLMTAFDVVLYRITGQSDVLVGTPIANRGRAETEALIGFFVNTLVIRSAIDGAEPWRALAQRVKATTLAAYEHQDTPFEQVVDAVAPRRSLSHTPLFQVMLSLQNVPFGAPALGDLKLEVVELETGTSRFDLAIDLAAGERGMRGIVEYSVDLFDDATIARIVEQFTHVLQGMVAHPDARIWELPVLGAAERARCLAGHRGDAPEQRCVHELIAARAAAAPAALAVRFEGGELTYGELDRKANQLAHHLRELGVRVETRVALCVRRSADAVIGFIAILKAGGVYVPIDPDYPADRIAFILDDCGAEVMLTHSALAPALPTRRAAIVCIDTESFTGDAPIPSSTVAANLAYVIYTSGSTGRPKGVAVQHGSLSNYASHIATMLELGPTDRVLQSAAMSFDASIDEITSTLAAGATLVLRDDSMMGSYGDFLRRCDEHELTIMSLPTAYWHHLTEAAIADGLRVPARVRATIIGGEEARADSVAIWCERVAPGTTLFNAYGPTETTIAVTAWAARPGDPKLRHRVPIGRPIAHVGVYVLDAQLQPAPIGIAGSLYVGGGCLARGYLDRPGLTADRFVPDPYGTGDRLYRTGDLGRLTADGELEYLGRLDDQVKIRGFRIELGEIEAALVEQPGVRAAAVLAREDVPGVKRLVAYWVAEGATRTTSDLRDALAGRLPEYMVPAAFVALDVLPLLPSGKVDRRALPAPVWHEQEGEYVEPRTDRERALAAIWRDVLGVERVGVRDNFFELGGDSIVSIQVVARGRRAGLELAPRDLFEHQTIEALARAVREGRRVDAEQGEVTGEIPLTPIQHELLDSEDPEQARHCNQSLLLRPVRHLDRAQLERALRAVVAHHDALRMTYARDDRTWRQTNLSVAAVPMTVIDETITADGLERRADQINAELDLGRGDLVRAALFDLGGGEQRLLLVIHHLVVDGVSWRILLEDLARACDQDESGEPIDLGHKTTSFRQWAMHLVEYATSPVLAQEAEHWRGTIAGAQCVPLDMPDADGGANTIATRRSVITRFSREDTEALLGEVPKAYRMQVNDVLVAALTRALHGWTGRTSQWIDLEGHGREEDVVGGVDLSRTVGWFTTLYPVRLDVTGVDLAADLKQVKERLRAVPHHGLGYGVLRHLAGLPLAAESGVVFNYLGQVTASSDARFETVRIGFGADRGLAARRTHALDVTAVVDRELAITWTFSTALHRESTIDALAQRFVAELRAIVAHCRAPGAGGYTPSDFPLAALDQRELDALWRDSGEIDDAYGLTPVQQGILFHKLSDPASSAYVDQMCVRLRGSLDRLAFERAWSEVVHRHDALRARYVWESGTAVQVILRHVDFAVGYLDWRAIAPADQTRDLAVHLDEDRAQGFDLARPPLMRVTLIRLGDDDYRLVWSQHHIMFDGWSMGLVLKDMLEIYGALRRGARVEIAPAPPFREHIAWLARQDRKAAERYWRAQLAGFEAPTRLSIERAGGQIGHGHYELAIARELHEALHNLARERRLTTSTILYGAWALLLARYSGTDDVVFGITTSGRPPELDHAEETVGLFITTLPARVRVPDDARLMTWLAALQTQQAEQRRFEYSALVDVQGWSEVPRGVALFDSLVVIENYPLDRAVKERPGALAADVVHVSEQTSYPLAVVVVPGDAMTIRIGHDFGRYDAATIARLAGHLTRLLAAMAERPEAMLCDLPILTDAERGRVAEEWRATTTSAAGRRCVHDLVSARASETPDAIAVELADQTLRYRDLELRANRLAHRLRDLGVGPDGLVGVAMAPSVDRIVGILAILKAGGAYVPLDPSYPADRIAYMIADSRVAMVLTDVQLRTALPAGIAVIALDDPALDLSVESDQPPAVAVDPDHLAYVIYTSGSTGRPKGTAMPHAPLVNLLAWQATTSRATVGTRTLQLTSINFDVSFQEIFATLATGGCLVLASEDQRRDLGGLPAFLAEHAIERLYLPFVALEHLAEAALERDVRTPALREVITAGEQLRSSAVIVRWFEAVGATLHNHYGPTECHVVTAHALAPVPASWAAMPPIGRAIAATQAYVLDRWLEPVPVGVVGELYLGGACVARGYLGRPELTAERFVPDPHGAPGARMYRTGDLARRQDDGEIDYLGRADHQVKIRGFRVELGEVEMVLAAHAGVRAAAVVAREERPGVRRLVAYWVGGESKPTPAELRDALKQRLPEYMVPAALIELDALPLTPSGKVDRRALPEPAWGDHDGEYVAARGEREQVLAAVWQAVLGVERVGVRDNFFELGGDSILSIQVVARARRAGLELSPRELFEHQTIEALARAARTVRRIDAEQGEITGEVALTPIQHWLLDDEEPEEARHCNQSLLLRPVRHIDRGQLELAVRAVIAHHDALRMAYRHDGGAWRQANLAVAAVSVAVAQEAIAADAIERRADQINAELDLARGDLVRAVLFELGDGEQRLLLVIHHLVVDGVSWRIVLDDLERACDQLARGVTIDLGRKTTSFRQWAERVTAYAAEPAVAAEADYWRSVGSGASSVPVDFPDGANTTATSRSIVTRLSRDDTQALLADVPKAYRTQVNDVLLVALARTFHHWTGHTSHWIELEGHGREEDVIGGVDLSRTVGWFTSLFPVRLDLTGADLAADLKHVKEQLRAVPHRGLGYGVLRYIRREPELAGAEVGFNYLGQVDTALTGRWFEMAQIGAGAGRGASARWRHALDITPIVSGGELAIDWRYSDELHRRETVEAVAARFVAELRAIIAHCRTPGIGGYTPSDFPLAGLDQRALDELWRTEGDVEDIYRLTPLQEGILFHRLVNAESRAYVNQLDLRLRGPLDRTAFGQVWRELVRRHDVLRAGFHWEADRAVQVVRRDVDFDVHFEDWRGRTEHERDLAAYRAMDLSRDFDLACPPLVRVTLIRTGEDEHRLVWTLHHIVLDGWSTALVLQEVLERYRAISRGTTTRAMPARAFREHVAWLARQDRAAATRYWTQALAGFEAPTRLWVEAADEHDHGQAAWEIALSPSRTRALQRLGRERRLTTSTFVQGAWALLLSHYSGASDVVFGTTVSGRAPDLEGFEEVIGLFINTLPTRVRIPAAASVGAWLGEVQAQQAEQRRYEYSALIDMQAASEVPRGEALFDSILVVENYPVDRALHQLTGPIAADEVRVAEETHYPLTVVAIPGETLALRIAYDRARFRADTVARMGDHLVMLLEAIAAQPDARVDELPALPPGERARVLAPGITEHGTSRCIHQWFEAQVERTPDAPAVTFEGTSLTYRELDRRANQLARVLRGRGVGPDVLVALCLERSLELVVSILGVLKAGGAYVPIDPSYPPDRVAYMIRDAVAAVLVTQASVIAATDHAGVVVDLDRDRALLDREPVTPLACATDPANLAYIIYTSGSTGRPKGVQVTHANVDRLLAATEHWFHFGAEDVWTLFHSYAFDFSVWELWGPLAYGGRVVVVPHWVARDSMALHALLARERVTVFNQTPSSFYQFMRADEQAGQALALRYVIFGGEALDLRALAPWYGRHTEDRPRLVNMYGITETTVHVTYRALAALDARLANGSLIGGAIPDLRLYVLDRAGRLAPIGVAGELHVAGAGLARGYRGRPDLTAERFVPDPFCGGGERMYRTGDLARWLADGSLEYLGRIDHQVKIRGFRIELGEIETAIVEQPGVRGAVVLAREDTPGQKRLVAYVVGDVDVAVLRAALGRRLPDHMVPMAFVPLAAIPLTSNGKVDRKALPAPEYHGDDATYAAPRTPAEARLAAIWQDVLGVQRVGIHDDFFDLGGDSIVSIQVVARARREGLQLQPRLMFEHPSIAELALHVQEVRPIEAEQEPVIGAVPLTPIQRWFFEQALAEPYHFNQVLLLRPTRRLDRGALQRALDAVVAYHDALRTAFHHEPGRWEAAGLAAMPVPVVAATGDAITEHAARVQAAISLDGPLVGVALIELGPERGQRVLVAIHHLVVDGVSWRILLEDLERAYQQASGGAPIRLDPKTTSYRKWATRLAAYASADELAADRAYWRAAHASAVTALPQDFAGDVVHARDTAELAVTLDRVSTQALVAEAPAAYQTQINELLLTALVRAFRGWTGRRSLDIDLEGHGREQELIGEVDLSRTVGWFTTIFPVTLTLPGDDLGTAIKSVKEQLRAVPHHGFGYGVLKYLAADPALADARRAPVLFNYLGQLDAGRGGALFELANEPVGAGDSPANRRPYVLEINASIVDGALRVTWSYSRALHRDATIGELAGRYLSELGALIAHCRSAGAGGYTPSDFPLAGLSQDALDQLLDEEDDDE